MNVPTTTHFQSVIWYLNIRKLTDDSVGLWRGVVNHGGPTKLGFGLCRQRYGGVPPGGRRGGKRSTSLSPGFPESVVAVRPFDHLDPNLGTDYTMGPVGRVPRPLPLTTLHCRPPRSVRTPYLSRTGSSSTGTT